MCIYTNHLCVCLCACLSIYLSLSTLYILSTYSLLLTHTDSDQTLTPLANCSPATLTRGENDSKPLSPLLPIYPFTYIPPLLHRQVSLLWLSGLKELCVCECICLLLNWALQRKCEGALNILLTTETLQKGTELWSTSLSRARHSEKEKERKKRPHR